MFTPLCLDLSRKHGFSVAAVESVIRFYGIRHGSMIMEALNTPTSKYYVRVNTLKTSRRDVLRALKYMGIRAFPSRLLPEAIYLVTEGPFSIKPQGKKVFADKFASESVYVGADLYVPGVKKAPKVRAGDVVTIYSPSDAPVAVGIAQMDGVEMETGKKGIAVKVTRSVYRVPSLRATWLHSKGLIYEQSLPAMLASRILSPKPGWTIVDMCSAPGGKASHIAQLMGDEGTVIAVDRNNRKIEAISTLAARLGLKSIKPLAADSRYLDEELSDLLGSVDAVIIDPPCSALGVRPKLYYDKSYFDLAVYPRYQRQFFLPAYKLLKKGGLIIYSTCTILPPENEFNVVWAIKRFKLQLIGQPVYYGLSIKIASSYVQKFLPHLHDTPGFFIALFRKI